MFSAGEWISAQVVRFAPLVGSLMLLSLVSWGLLRTGATPRVRSALLVLLGAASVIAVGSVAVASGLTTDRLLPVGLFMASIAGLAGIALWLHHFKKPSQQDHVHVHFTNLSIALMSGAAVAFMLFSLQIVIAREAEQRAFQLLIGASSDLRGFSPPAGGVGGTGGLDGVRFRGKDLRRADFNHTSLRDAEMSFVNLDGATLQCADLRGADLRNALLTGADLKGARLDNAILIDADLSGAMLHGASLDGVRWSATNVYGVQVGDFVADGVEHGVDTDRCERYQQATSPLPLPVGTTCQRRWRPSEDPREDELSEACGSRARQAWYE